MSINANKIIVIALLGGTAAFFLHVVGKALAPFALAAVAAYIVSPLVGKMERWGVKSSLAAGLLTLLIVLAILALPLALLPLVISQLSAFAAELPALITRAGNWLGEVQPHLVEQLQALNPIDAAKRAAAAAGAEGVLKTVTLAAGVFGQGVSAVLFFSSILLITPLAAFYFIRDRKIIGGELTDIMPPRMRHKSLQFFSDLDSVLGEFMHGQIAVMAVMATIYTLILKLAGLQFALTIGIISGVLVFIPYVGFLIGLLLATVAGLGQFDSWTDFVLIWVLMGIGTTLESLLITPYLVGERIGLHPLAVILALFIMGELLGFVGVLAALPLSAILLVLCRHLRRYYINSDFYAEM